jgi:hypothetical protein
LQPLNHSACYSVPDSGGAHQMYRKLVSIRLYALMFASFLCCATQAFGQECPLELSTGPSTPSTVRTLEGQLIFHNNIRGWFELKLDRTECGHNSVQLVQFNENATPLELFRGCRIRSSGTIDFSSTGYYSAVIFQNAENVEPVGACVMQPPFPDYSSARPDDHVRAYTVDMHVDYRPGDHPVEFHVRSAGRQLRPWQAYASYMLTGGFVLYGHCADGFVIDRVYGTPAARPTHFEDPRTPEDMATFDPESAAAAGKTDLHLGYTCIREPHPEH